jgi:hypothetical protein
MGMVRAPVRKSDGKIISRYYYLIFTDQSGRRQWQKTRHLIEDPQGEAKAQRTPAPSRMAASPLRSHTLAALLSAPVSIH